MGLCPFSSVIRDIWRKLRKTYWGEGLICFCLMWFLSLPLGDGQLKRSSFPPFTPLLRSRSTFFVWLTKSLVSENILDSGSVSQVFVLLLDKTNQGGWGGWVGRWHTSFPLLWGTGWHGELDRPTIGKPPVYFSLSLGAVEDRVDSALLVGPLLLVLPCIRTVVFNLVHRLM